MIQIIGWIGLIFLIVAYGVLNTENRNKYWLLNFISCILLLIYSVLIKEYIFMTVNFLGSLAFGFKLMETKGGVQ